MGPQSGGYILTWMDLEAIQCVCEHNTGLTITFNMLSICLLDVHFEKPEFQRLSAKASSGLM